MITRRVVADWRSWLTWGRRVAEWWGNSRQRDYTCARDDSDLVGSAMLTMGMNLNLGIQQTVCISAWH